MAFVSEKIKEEDKEYFNSIGFTQIDSRKKVKPYRWVIDRERNIVLTSRGRIIGEIFEGFQLYFKDELINIEAFEETEGSHFDGNLKCHWNIKKVEIPKDMIDKGTEITEIQQVICEAFIGAGYFGLDRSLTSEVTVVMEKELIIR